VGHIPYVATQMQIHPDLFQLCHYRFAAAWFVQRILVGRKADFQMSSMGGIRLRSGTMKKARMPCIRALN
jgi:hypothetical protein